MHSLVNVILFLCGKLYSKPILLDRLKEGKKMVDKMNEAIKRAMIREYGSKATLKYCPIPDGTVKYWSNKTGLTNKEVMRHFEHYVLTVGE